MLRMAKGYGNSSDDEPWGETQGKGLCPLFKSMIDRRRVTAKRESRNKVGDTILQGSLEIQRQAGGFPPHIQDSWDLVLQVLKDGRLGIRHLTSGLSFGKNKKKEL